MIKCLAMFALCAFVLIPASAQAECTRDGAQQKLDRGLALRSNISIEPNNFDEKIALYMQKVQAKLDVLDGHGANPAKSAELTSELCAEVDKTLAAADDILAGGDGTGGENPWQEYTPEQMLEIDREYEEACQEAETGICNEHSGPISDIKKEIADAFSAYQENRISMGELVDATARSLQQARNHLKNQ